MIRMTDKDPSESLVVEFFFDGRATAIADPVVTVAVAEGADDAPAAILLGSATASGTRVLQRVRNGVDGVDYFLRCLVTAGDDTLAAELVLPVRVAPAVPAYTVKYLAEADFARQFGEDELEGLLRDGNSFGQVENEAAGLIDGYIGARYSLPLATVPSMVKAWCADITRYRLWDEKAPEEIRRRYEDTLKQLELVARGIVVLPVVVAPPVEGVEAEAFSADRVFTAETLKHF